MKSISLRFCFVLILLFCCMNCLFAVTEINSCQGLSSNNYYLLNSSIVATGTCLTIPDDSSNITIDLNGFNITGPGANYGIYLQAGGSFRYNEVLVKNGVIENFGLGFYYLGYSYNQTTNFQFDNLTFVNNTGSDIYLRNDALIGKKNATISNCLFENTLKFNYLRNLNLIDNIYYNGTLALIGIDNFNIVENSKDYIELYNFDFDGINNFVGSNQIGVKNLCDSSFTRDDSNFEIILLNDETSVGNCLNVPDGTENVIIDLNGHTLTGDNVNDGFYLQGANSDRTNIILIKNGVIENFGLGFYYLGYSYNQTTNFQFDNLTFVNNTGSDIYLRNNALIGEKNATISNCLFESTLQFNYLRNLNFYLNNISSANDITLTGVDNIVTNIDTGDGEIGNIWGDFVCSDENNSHVVNYLGNDYTICDSDSYSINGIVDDYSIIGSVYVGLPGTGGSSVDTGSIFPYASGFGFVLGNILLVLFFLFF